MGSQFDTLRTTGYVISFPLLTGIDVRKAVDQLLAEHLTAQQWIVWQENQPLCPAPRVWHGSSLTRTRLKNTRRVRILHEQSWCKASLYQCLIDHLALSSDGKRLLKTLLRAHCPIIIYYAGSLGRNFIPAVVRRDLGKTSACRRIDYVLSGVWHKRPHKEVVYDIFPPDKYFLSSMAKSLWCNTKRQIIAADRLEEARVWQYVLPNAELIGVCDFSEDTRWQPFAKQTVALK